MHLYFMNPQFQYLHHHSEYSLPTALSHDLSFSIPDWRQKEIKSIHTQYEKEIYNAVQFNLTDFDQREQTQFLSPPQKSEDEKYAYIRKLVNVADFSILAFILCLEQLLVGEQKQQGEKLQKLKKKINELDLCCLSQVPAKMGKYYENKIIKKILFQYINKGSYNVSLLEVLLKRNSVLKFGLSLVSKSILKKRGLITGYTQKIPLTIEMKNCADQFGILPVIKVKEKCVETQNFFVQLEDQSVNLLRKQNFVKINRNIEKENRKVESTRKRSLSPNIKRYSKRPNDLDIKTQKETLTEDSRKSRSKDKSRENKRSASVVSFFKKFFCY